MTANIMHNDTGGNLSYLAKSHKQPAETLTQIRALFNNVFFSSTINETGAALGRIFFLQIATKTHDSQSFFLIALTTGGGFFNNGFQLRPRAHGILGCQRSKLTIKKLGGLRTENHLLTTQLKFNRQVIIGRELLIIHDVSRPTPATDNGFDSLDTRVSLQIVACFDVRALIESPERLEPLVFTLGRNTQAQHKDNKK